jgi:hypothetical protein
MPIYKRKIYIVNVFSLFEKQYKTCIEKFWKSLKCVFQTSHKIDKLEN